MGISKNISKPEEKELGVSNTSEVGSEKFYFGVERFGHSVRRPVIIEVKDIVIMLVESSRNHIERLESGFFHLLIPSCHVEPCRVLNRVLGKNHA